MSVEVVVTDEQVAIASAQMRAVLDAGHDDDTAFTSALEAIGIAVDASALSALPVNETAKSEHVEGDVLTWQPIETAPKDGTVIDVWRKQGGRETVSWGLRPHDCGEMGPHCDSDWHSENKPGWVCATFGEFVGGKHNPFTHWMPLPPPPRDGER
ncbi:MAG: DUF551 domain-containing protein [Devosia sp.]|uniref:DUF551 domain-containing protein n=1 Tax=Devosia sp. TaxID=1871048 RepID=UPI003391BCF7